jgi:hypothetical protein
MRAILILTAAILLLGCFEEAEEEVVFMISKHPDLQNCNNRPTPLEREECYVEVAVDKLHPILCDEISLPNLKNLCHHKVAKKNMNPKQCYAIQNDEWRFNDCIVYTSGNR